MVLVVGVHVTKCPDCGTELKLVVEVTYIYVPFTVSKDNDISYSVERGLESEETIYATYCPKCDWEFLH